MTLEQRLATLERRCRILRGIVATMLLVAGITLLSGAGLGEVSTELKATVLNIVDADGNERIRLSGDERLSATYLDREGRPRVMLGALENAGVVPLFNEQGRAIDLIANNQGGQIGLSKNGKFPVAVLSADKNARLELRQNGNQRTVYPVEARLH